MSALRRKAVAEALITLERQRIVLINLIYEARVTPPSDRLVARIRQVGRLVIAYAQLTRKTARARKIIDQWASARNES